MRTVDGVNIHDGYHFCKKCGWIGKVLLKNGSVTFGDTWWECPSCRVDGSNIDIWNKYPNQRAERVGK